MVLPKFFNFLFVVTKFFQDGFRVLSQFWNHVKTCRTARKLQRAADDGNRPHRRFHFPDHVAGDDLGMSQDLRDSPDFSVRQAAFFEPAQPFLVRLLQKNLLDLEAFDLVSGCLSNPLEDLENGFKACCVSLLGELGRDYRLQPHILPLIWRALVDYGSAWVRAKAIQAAGEMFSSSTASPPANLVDTIIVHLQDPKVVVHQAALRAVSRHPSWFDEKQSFEVLKCLYAHLHAYRDDKIPTRQYL